MRIQICTKSQFIDSLHATCVHIATFEYACDLSPNTYILNTDDCDIHVHFPSEIVRCVNVMKVILRH